MAKKVIPVKRSKRRPWLTHGTLYITDVKRIARLSGWTTEYHRLKSAQGKSKGRP